jgi:hypothetical protein
MEHDTGTLLASFVDPEDLAVLKRRIVPNNHLPAQFHRKFWGKSMVDEEQQWCNTQPPVQDEEGQMKMMRQT